MASSAGTLLDRGEAPAARFDGLARAVLVFASVRLLVLATVVGAALVAGRSPWRVLTRWDSQWYRHVAESGYGHPVLHHDGRLLSDYAFFPLLPLLERGIGSVLHVPELVAGLAISVAASLVAAAGIYVWGARLYGPRVAMAGVLTWSLLPMAPVLWLPYSESLFTALAVWALYAVHHRAPVTAGVLAALAGSCRPTGAAVAVAVVVVLCRDLLCPGPPGSRPADATGRRVLGAALAPLGTVGYLGYVAWQHGQVLGYFRVVDGWDNTVDGGQAFAAWIVRLVRDPPHWPGVLVLVGLAGAVTLLVACARQRQPVGLLVFAFGMFTLAMITSGYFGSKPRYLLPAFPLLFPVAEAVARMPRRTGFLVWVGATVAAAAYGAIWLLGSGPP